MATTWLNAGSCYHRREFQQQICAVLVDRKVAELVDNQHGRLEVAVELLLELASGS
jgi:hypothetical protein